jgi:hypothetical protein
MKCVHGNDSNTCSELHTIRPDDWRIYGDPVRPTWRVFCWHPVTAEDAVREHAYYSDIRDRQCRRCGRWWRIPQKGDTKRLIKHMMGVNGG